MNTSYFQLFPSRLRMPSLGLRVSSIKIPFLDGENLLVMTNSLPWLLRWPIEIDGLPINSMVISMANC